MAMPKHLLDRGDGQWERVVAYKDEVRQQLYRRGWSEEGARFAFATFFRARDAYLDGVTPEAFAREIDREAPHGMRHGQDY